jgi:ribonuclease III
VKLFGWLKRSSADPAAGLEKIIGYRFKNRNLLNEALSHRSSLKDTGRQSNERLEFLGDAILGLIVSTFLYRNNSQHSEGELTRMKAGLVNETVLAQVAQSFHLGKFLFMSPEEDKSGGRNRLSITADAFEALIGAIYLDGGYAQAEMLVNKYILQGYKIIIGNEQLHNYKGELLEYLQAQGQGMPHYKVSDQIGPDHDKLFVVWVYANGEKIGEGEGHSKKEAEQKAARQALQKIKKGGLSQ